MARILHLADATHARCEALLPWYVNGTLDSAERSLVDGHIGSCERCLADLARLRAIADEVRDLDVDPDRDEALSRLTARLDAGDDYAPSVVARSHGWLSTLWHDAHALRFVVVLQVGVLAALAVIGLRPAPDAGYRTLAAAGVPDRGRMIVTFDGRQPEAAIRQVLVAAEARVVDGPTPNGLYVIEVAAPRAAAVAAQLRLSDAVVRVDLATPVQ